MADRMRSNRAALIDPTTSPYNNTAGTAVGNSACLGLDNDGSPNGSQCAPTEMAFQDFYEWANEMGGHAATGWHAAYPAGLPNGQGIVCIDSTPDDGEPGAVACDNIITVSDTPVYAIKIWWKERIDNQAAYHRYIMSFTP